MSSEKIGKMCTKFTSTSGAPRCLLRQAGQMPQRGNGSMHSAKPLACVCTKVLAAEFVTSRRRWGDPASGFSHPRPALALH